MRQLLGDADLSPPRPAHAVPLLQLLHRASRIAAPSAIATTSSSWAPARNAWRRNCTAAFPRARIARLDRDTVRGKRDYETILSGFREGSFDILVGTQMIAKGHDIPNVTLVGVVNADIGLGLARLPRRRTHLPAC